MTPHQAQTLLGLLDAECASAQSIRAAWAKRARAAHPDTGTMVFDDPVDSVVALAQIGKARDLLLANLKITSCRNCSGTGFTRGKIGAIVCVACEGTGTK